MPDKDVILSKISIIQATLNFHQFDATNFSIFLFETYFINC